ncbi:hypothetical protein ACZ90_11565 [Streptomyces albus subsp. albus]|nr:hypothetical protein ACZ90_11565 [Streptomyces albus subsp. albus]
MEALRAAMDTVPDRPAVVQGDMTLTYRQLGLRVTELAGRLERLGAAGQRVALALPNGPAMAVAVFAGLAARAQVAPLNGAYPAAEMRPLLAAADPVAVITDSAAGTAGRLATERGTPLLVLGAADVTGDVPLRSPAGLPRGPEPGDLATLMFTGGTTGVPKGVDHSHRGLMRTVRAMDACWPTGSDGEVWLTVAPMFHIWGLLMGLLNPVLTRATVVSLPRFHPAAALEAMARHRVTVFSGGPAAVYAALLGAPAEAGEAGVRSTDCLTRLRVCPGGGSPFPPDLLDRWQRTTGIPIREAFGMTELAPITAQPPGRPPRPGTTGLPAPWVSVRIAADDSAEPLPPGTVGEILARGPHQFLGYRGRPADSAAALTDGWLRTGDLGFLDEDGWLHVVDRKKDMILVGGFNVYPREIDEVLVAHPEVRQSVTIAVPDPRKGERPASFVVPEPGRAPDPAGLLAHCAGLLVGYKRPVTVTIVERLPLTPANKVDRAALRRCLAASPPG